LAYDKCELRLEHGISATVPASPSARPQVQIITVPPKKKKKVSYYEKVWSPETG
jgi:hypothetical protein